MPDYSNPIAVLLLNGPKLNLLGMREPDKYGSKMLSNLETCFVQAARGVRMAAGCFQSSSEGALVDRIHGYRSLYRAGQRLDCAFNPGAPTDASVVRREAVHRIGGLPVVERHVANVPTRAESRQHAFIVPAAASLTSGLGVDGFSSALQKLVRTFARVNVSLSIETSS